MSRRLAVLGLTASGCAMGLGPLWAQQSRPPVLVFERVTVIDMTDGKLMPQQTVVISGNRIRAVGPSGRVEVPKQAQVVEARGKYLIPGLWDMHVHVDGRYPLMYQHAIAQGVTGLREMAQRHRGLDSFLVWRREIMAGTRVGPRVAGPSADISGYHDNGGPAPAAIPRIVDSLKAAGDPFIKYHGGGFQGVDIRQREILFTLLREARRVGLPVAGHVPRVVTNVDAADSGLSSIEHSNEHRQCWPEPGPLGDSVVAEQRCAPLAQAYVRNGTWMVPTLWIRIGPRSRAGRSLRLFDDTMRFWRMMRRFGVTRFLAGTDWASSNAQDIPLLQELVLLTEAGLTPLEALQAATLNPAKFFNATDSLGTVAPGKLADLVLLDANPLIDIRHTAKLRAVVANGRYFDRAALDALAPQSAKLAEGLAAWQPRARAERVAEGRAAPRRRGN